MPAKSEKQRRFMAAVANNPEFSKKVGVPKSVGEEFMNKGKKLEMVKDPATGKMVPSYAMDGEGAGDMAKGKKGMKPEMKPKKKKKRPSDDMNMMTGGNVKGYKSGCSVKGYKSGGKVRGSGIARKSRACKMVKMKGA